MSCLHSICHPVFQLLFYTLHTEEFNYNMLFIIVFHLSHSQLTKIFRDNSQQQIAELVVPFVVSFVVSVE